MANVYLIDKKFGNNSLRIAEQDKNAEIVLIQDGIYLDVKRNEDSGNKVYAVKDDVKKRGYNELLSKNIELIDYGKLVDIILASKVVNFA
ncbi:MAG: DsrH/TusB family sulfur metabolism protein [Planctomycetota bacterium]|jgi:sulfur relay protein TusB/DsrH